MNTFKNGDKIYVPKVSTEVLVVYCADEGDYPIVVGDKTFTTCGRQYQCDDVPSIIHATQQNKELLEKLYGVEFEAVPPKTRTVTFEMPETFIPKLNESYWFVSSSYKNGVASTTNCNNEGDLNRISNGVWRTKEEALQVANAIFKLNKD